MMVALNQIKSHGFGSWGICNIYANMLRQGLRAPPIVLAKEGDKYRVIDGEHRLEACRIARRTKIKAVIVEAEK
jgi:uncharacterized ParB-like nuclease family protein